MLEGVGERLPDGRPRRVVVGGGRHVRTRVITCNERTCDAFTVAHLVRDNWSIILAMKLTNYWPRKHVGKAELITVGNTFICMAVSPVPSEMPVCGSN